LKKGQGTATIHSANILLQSDPRKKSSVLEEKGLAEGRDELLHSLSLFSAQIKVFCHVTSEVAV